MGKEKLIISLRLLLYKRYVCWDRSSVMDSVMIMF